MKNIIHRGLTGGIILLIGVSISYAEGDCISVNIQNISDNYSLKWDIQTPKTDCPDDQKSAALSNNNEHRVSVSPSSVFKITVYGTTGAKRYTMDQSGELACYGAVVGGWHCDKRYDGGERE
ncbi:MAG: hypothetical protein A3F17_00365 [Gammaproteobacteria bacterium RIFCSPHIGHO2_12_FULL_41_15]|nr:MAG: hypothetical protein A3F17_00365 [Gammaproteobacteria bacterium RIFCSPHIGHO2_12_FULL_41_15]